MGILGLAKLLADAAPQCMKENEMKNYFGRKIAIDASMSLYQFLIAVRSEGAQLTSVDGETTSHLMGTFYRTIRLIENGLKPVYVFDGKPPDLKSGELEKRAEKREEAQKSLEKATEAGDLAEIDKFNRRLVKVTKSHVEDVKQLLDLMGVPFVEAPCEAEAQCAALVKAGKVYATATEDMDALTFGSNILIRHLTFSESRKIPIQEIYLNKAIEELQISMAQFVDLCILLGCDYCDSIRGIGPKKAIELIKSHKSIDHILETIDSKKFIVPENWIYKEARNLFLNPEVKNPDTIDLKWSDPNEDELVKFLCGDRQFNEQRVRNGAAKLLKARRSQTQSRLDSFFTTTAVVKTVSATKRKNTETDENKKNAKTKNVKKIKKK